MSCFFFFFHKNDHEECRVDNLNGSGHFPFEFWLTWKNSMGWFHSLGKVRVIKSLINLVIMRKVKMETLRGSIWMHFVHRPLCLRGKPDIYDIA